MLYLLAMPKLKFSDRAIRALKPPDRGQTDYYDASRNVSRGLGLRVGYGGSKAWFTKLAFRGQQQRITHGQYPTMGLADARAEHERVKALARQGTDPRSERKAEQGQLTFKALADRYIAEYAKTRKRTWAEDERILGRYFRKWHKHRADKITAVDAYKLLKNLAEEGLNGRPAPIMANRARACASKLNLWDEICS